MAERPPRHVVYFASVDWGYTWQRPQQIASRLARNGQLLYVDPLGLRAPRLRDLGRFLARGRTTRDPNRPPSLSVLSPRAYLPFPRLAAARRVNALLLGRAVRSWMRRVGVTRPLAWIGTPALTALDVASAIAPEHIVYDCLDLFAAFHAAGGDAIASSESVIAARADVVFASSQALLERMQALNPRARLLQNAADYPHFAAAAAALPAPPALAHVPHPILGYYGEIADWVDTELLAELADAHPAWSLVLIGPWHAPRAQGLLTRPNVHHIPRVDYSELPRHLAQFDVCLLPFRPGPLTDAVSPVKLFEFLASGRPIVSSPIREAAPFADVVTIATREGFAEAVRKSLGSHDASTSARRMAVARANTWEHRLAEIVAAL